MMVSFVLSFFPRDVLDEILNLIESVSEDFPSYSWNSLQMRKLSETPMDTFSVATHCLQVQTLKTLLDNQSTNGIGVSRGNILVQILDQPASCAMLPESFLFTSKVHEI